MKAQAAGEQAVAVSVVDHHAWPDAGQDQGASDHFGTHVQTSPRVTDDGRLAARATRGVDPHQLLARDSEQAERVVLPQVDLAREREALQVLESAQIARRAEANRLQSLAHRRHAAQLELQRGPQSVELQRRELLARQSLGLGVPEHAAPRYTLG